MTGSEMKFYKIDDQDFIFSVKAHDTGAIRYYQAIFSDDSNCNVRRIKNSFNFLSGQRERAFSRVKEFSSDYVKIITSLINYCETPKEQEEKKNAEIGQIYFRLLRDINGSSNQDIKVTNTDDVQTSLFYEIDSEDRTFISSGIANNNAVNIFKLK